MHFINESAYIPTLTGMYSLVHNKIAGFVVIEGMYRYLRVEQHTGMSTWFHVAPSMSGMSIKSRSCHL